MNIENLPPAGFIDPRGANRAEVERLARAVLEMVLTLATSAAARAPLPASGFPERSAFIPGAPVAEDELLAELSEILADSMNAANPGYVGHMDTMPTLVSMLGDLAAASVNNNLLSLEMSPVFSRLEDALLREIAGLFGFGAKAGGVMVAGGTLANLQALTIARNAKFAASRESGVARLEKPPVLFASEAAHTSLDKAAMILGLGTEAVVKVATGADSKMEGEDLRRKIRAARRGGFAPFCVVATAGTTVTGSIDPLDEIADVAARNDLWFHVDAAYGGALVFSPKYKKLLAGIERADSVTFNPQKWLYVAKTCAMALFRDRAALERAFRVSAPYMGDTGGFTNIGEISVQGTHHADVLKLWLSLRHIGKNGYARLIEESYKLTDYFFAQVKKRAFLQAAGAPETNLVCFRFATGDEADADALNARAQRHLLREAQTFFSLPVYRGNRWLRAVLLNPYADERIVDRAFAAIDDFAAREL
ncbi:MAG TPA: pyridoxal-dependent decarboxylase [Pyrinomonadaceae bacterium]|jgi:glutamate/tyrosine decarboxylase-like PLP-dependent enzyme